MIYDKLLLNILGIYNIDFGFCIPEKQKKEIEKYNKNNILNLIAFAPINYSDKEKILNLAKEGFPYLALKTHLEENYKRFSESKISKELFITKYTQSLFDWVLIVSTIKKFSLSSAVKQIKENLTSQSEEFWFAFVKCFYDKHKYKETISLIKFVKKEILSKDSHFYNRLTLFEVVALRDGYFYLEDTKIMKNLCKKAKELKDFSYLKIITVLECHLLSNEIVKFLNTIDDFSNHIINWQITEILNLFELVVYSKDKTSFELVDNILRIRDIKSYEGNKEYLIYQFLMAVYNKNIFEIARAKEKLEDYDFSHFEWYKKQKGIN